MVEYGVMIQIVVVSLALFFSGKKLVNAN